MALNTAAAAEAKVQQEATTVIPIGDTAPNLVQSILAESSHPTALIFHYLFRSAAVAVYFFLGSILDNFILVFIGTVLLLSLDFWTVKNVTGRLLVGLRWWSEPPSGSGVGGQTVWIFESRAVIGGGFINCFILIGRIWRRQLQTQSDRFQNVLVGLVCLYGCMDGLCPVGRDRIETEMAALGGHCLDPQSGQPCWV